MISFRMLGSVELRDSQGRELDAILRRPKLLALLGYLTFARPWGFQRRDTLVALLWPELDHAHARNALNQAVHALRQALGREALRARGEEEVGTSDEDISCDVREFEAALEADQAEQALELYRGSLFNGFHLSEVPEFERWLDEERERVRRRACGGAQLLIDRDQTARNPVGVGVRAGGRLLIGRLAGAHVAKTREPKTLVVLPFANLGPTGDQYFTDGVTEEITARLSAIGELRVIASTSANLYRNGRKGIREIGAELGADYVLEGSVRWERSAQGPARVRVTPQLITTADATHLWAEVYDEPLDEIFRVQGDIAQKVVRALDVRLLEPQRRQHFLRDRKSTRLNSSHRCISYAVFCLKKKKNPSNADDEFLQEERQTLVRSLLEL